MVMMFRRCRCQKYLIGALVVNVIVLLYLAFMQHSERDDLTESRRGQRTHFEKSVGDNKVLHGDRSNDITVIIREFEDFEQDIVHTALNIFKVFKNIHVVVIGDKYPYPPINTINITRYNFYYVPIKNSLWQNLSSSRPEFFLRREFVFIVPDATAIEDASIFRTLTKTISSYNSSKVLAIPFKNSNLLCSPINYNYRTWTLEYSSPKLINENCNNVIGEHGLFMRTETLLQLSQPYLQPIPLSLYIQGSIRQWTVKVVDNLTISSLRSLYQTDPHNRWKHKHNQEVHHEHMYRQLGVKLVIQNSGRRQWYGCSKDTERCFDTVVNDMPEYLYEKRWTPPCCLQALRETSRHVFSILDSCEARYWLEGGSLLGAARHGDIIPWDYDIDIGIYQNDISKCDYLKQCSQGSYIDESGFVWEKAREGDFYRVQFSESNRLHVDIFPFFSRNGTMTKNTWIKSHRQDTEFPEKFLKPLTKIKFGGLEVNAPNNVKEFLEFKFGVGVIEHPKYPNAKDQI